MKSEKLGYIQGLRGYSIILIVLWHLNYIFPNCLPSTGDKGVEFFFLISGFLVAYKYFENGELATLKTSFCYAIGKVKQIYPLYFLTMILMIALPLCTVFETSAGGKKLIFSIFTNIFLVQSWVPNSEIYWSLNGVTWFLSSLIFCYAASFITLKWLKKQNGLSGILFILMIQFIVEVFALKYMSEDLSTWLTYVCPAFRFLDYSMGMCVFKLTKDISVGRENTNCTLLGLGASILLYVLISIIGDNTIQYYTVYHVFEVAIFSILVLYSGNVRKYIFENKIAVAIGNISMEIFLTHRIVITYGAIIWDKLIGVQVPAIVEWIVLFVLIVAIGYFINALMAKIRRSTRRRV